MPAQIVGFSSIIKSSWLSDGVFVPAPAQTVPSPAASPWLRPQAAVKAAVAQRRRRASNRAKGF